VGLVSYHRTLLGDLSRVAARSVTAFIRATLGELRLSVGIVSAIQNHGSLANWHPHLHMLVTDGGFAPTDTAGVTAPETSFALTLVYVLRDGEWKTLLGHESFPAPESM
jgi:hypothetical protein